LEDDKLCQFGTEVEMGRAKHSFKIRGVMDEET
jgi:hypothetical protein